MHLTINKPTARVHPAGLNLNLKNTLIIWQDTVAWNYKTWSQNFPHCYNRASSSFSFSHCGIILAKLLLKSWHRSFFNIVLNPIHVPYHQLFGMAHFQQYLGSENHYALGKINRKALKLLSSKGGHYKKHPHFPEKTTQLVWLQSSSSGLGNDPLLDNIHDALEH